MAKTLLKPTYQKFELSRMEKKIPQKIINRVLCYFEKSEQSVDPNVRFQQRLIVTSGNPASALAVGQTDSGIITTGL